MSQDESTPEQPDSQQATPPVKQSSFSQRILGKFSILGERIKNSSRYRALFNRASSVTLQAAPSSSASSNGLAAYVRNKFQALSTREKAMVGVGVLTIAILVFDKAYTPFSEAFSTQAERLAELERNAKAAPFVTERYAKLRARREQLEQRFQQIQFKEGALSYLENLVRTEALVGSGFDIRELPARSFGPNYEQLPLTVRFPTSNPPALLNFMKAAVRGERPLLMTKLDIQKPRRGDRLDVDIELNSIRRAGGLAGDSAQSSSVSTDQLPNEE